MAPRPPIPAPPGPPRRRRSRSALVGAAILVAAVGTPSLATGQVVQGHVLDPNDSSALAGVDLRLLGPGDSVIVSATSGDEGVFRLEAPAPGPFRLTATMLGRVDVAYDVELDWEESLTVEVLMPPDPIRLEEPVVVVAHHSNPQIADFHRRRLRGQAGGPGDFIYREDLERSVGYRASDMVRTIAGVQVIPRPMGRGQLIRMRGGCIPALYVDGMQINRIQRGESLDTFVDVQSIEGIEVYRGAAQPGGVYLDRTGCGVILVWTRRGEYDPEATFSWTRLAVAVGLVAAVLLVR